MTEGTMSDQLLRQASIQGYLLVDDLLASLPEIDNDIDHLEDMLDDLESRGIEVYADRTEAVKAVGKLKVL